MSYSDFRVRVNEFPIFSVPQFTNYVSRYQNFQKDGVFVRLIGLDNPEQYLRDISAMDDRLTQERTQRQTGYLRLDSLAVRLDQGQAERYNAMLDRGELPVAFDNPLWAQCLQGAFSSTAGLFQQHEQATETILHNFKIMLMARMERYVPQLFLKTKGLGNFPKLVVYGPLKKQEYLFVWLLVQLGCDVLYLNPQQDLPPSFGTLLDLSAVYHAAKTQALVIPPKFAPTAPIPVASAQQAEQGARVRIDRERFRRPDRDRATPRGPGPGPGVVRPPEHAGGVAIKTMPSPAPRPNPSTGQELSYEELAGFAPSIVMIKVFNEKDDCFKTGSGVFINEGGYVLTNFHVTQNGTYYGICLEGHEDTYYTTELIKYHHLNDLALLRVDVACNPIPIYRGPEALRRGQKVVAIGSPRGLFNSVSDGIISGFRDVNDVSMVQFTAPTSPGSSGGALLDMRGNLIGIVTAGFEGQNLNIAVDFQTVNGFLRGFI